MTLRSSGYDCGDCGCAREERGEQAARRAWRLVETEMFMDAFNHISSHIDTIYKELTVKPGHMLGGTAFLTCARLPAPLEPPCAITSYVLCLYLGAS
eukprot:4209913-Pyramimonas_sp.AAC.2